jgi:hypothetical protein
MKNSFTMIFEPHFLPTPQLQLSFRITLIPVPAGLLTSLDFFFSTIASTSQIPVHSAFKYYDTSMTMYLLATLELTRRST